MLKSLQKNLPSSLVFFAKDIKIAHSIFALPFAFSVFFIEPMADITFLKLLLIFFCMVTARSYAMGMNRFLDRHIDKANERTKGRMIPSGHLQAWHSLFWSLTFAGFFIGLSFLLGKNIGYLSIPLLAILGIYSLMKRLSWWTHWYLGLCLGLAPVAVSVVMTGELSLAVLFLGCAVLFWVAGFDILYAIQDFDFDKHSELKSVPVKFMPKKSLVISALSSMVAVGFFALVGIVADLGAIYFIGLIIVTGLLASEHWLVRDVYKGRISANINKAFFDVNAWVGVVYFIFLVGDTIIYV